MRDTRIHTFAVHTLLSSPPWYRRFKMRRKVAAEDVQKRAKACLLPAAHCDVTWNLEPHLAKEIFEDMLRESGVRVLYEAQVASVQKVGTQLTSLTLTTGTVISARTFIEASYEGDLLAAAKVSTHLGRESVDKYCESLAGVREGGSDHAFKATVNPLAPDGSLLSFVEEADGSRVRAGDDRIPSYGFRLCVTQHRNISLPFSRLRPRNYRAQDWELLRRLEVKRMHRRLPSCNTKPVPNGKYDMNSCGPMSTDFVGASRGYATATYAQRRSIWHAHREYTQGLLYTLAVDPGLRPSTLLNETWGLCADEFTSSRFPGFPPTLYVREARRLVGDSVFSQHTPTEQARLPRGSVPSIGLGCYQCEHSVLTHV